MGRSQWTKQPDLNSNQEILYEKLCLLVLMEMTFRRDANDRQITFTDVSQQTGLNEDKVELLVMKALSKGLVKGHRDQLKTIMSKISTLNASIRSMENMIENNAGEIL